MDPAVSDERLVADYRAAPPHARDTIANELFARHYERVARWCFRFTGDRDTAADLAQDVFLKAHRHLHTFQGTSRFSTWLYAIVRNESFTRYQKRATQPVTDPDDVLTELPSLDPDPEHITAERSRGRRLHQFLADTLDATERQVFTLHYGNDMSLDAITRVLRLDNASGAKAYIVSAKRKLARAVQRQRARGDDL